MEKEKLLGYREKIVRTLSSLLPLCFVSSSTIAILGLAFIFVLLHTLALVREVK